MPRVIITTPWCSKCDRRDLQTQATRTFVVAVLEAEWKDGVMPIVVRSASSRRIDTCDPCGKELEEWAEVVEGDGVLVSELIAPPNGGGKTARPASVSRPPSSLPSDPCPECGAVLTNSSALAGHILMRHLGHTNNRPPAPTKCPECGAQYRSPTACGNHRSSAHNMSQLKDALNQLAALKSQPAKPARRGDHRKIRPRQDFLCPLCNRTLRAGPRLVAHAETQHRIVTVSQAGKCREPGCEYVAKTASGMGTHRRLQHGYDPVIATMDALTKAAA